MSTDLDFTTMLSNAAREFAGVELAELDMSKPISSLGLDSIAMFEVIGYFEQGLQLRLPDEELAQVRTLQDLKDVVERALHSR